MSFPATLEQSASSLPQLVDHAAAALANARTAAEVLEAKEVASFAYDAAKRAARLANAKHAHDELIAAAHRAQADSLAIESQAKRRLADEYDQARIDGTASAQGQRTDLLPDEKKVATVAELGLTHKEIHDARLIRDAEKVEPGIVRRTLDEKLARGEEPTRAALRKMVVDAAMRGLRPQRKPSRRNPLYVPPTPEQAAWQHVTGTFRAFAEWATDDNLALAREGMREARAGPFHRLDVKAIAQGRNVSPKSRSGSMLDSQSAAFAERVWDVASQLGNNAPKIADDIMEAAFPLTCSQARAEGAMRMLRTGIISEVKRILRNRRDLERQTDFADRCDAFAPLVSDLRSKSYFVESAEEYVAVPDLIAEPDLLDDARRFMRRKGLECLAEANRLDALYMAVTGNGADAGPTGEVLA